MPEPTIWTGMPWFFWPGMFFILGGIVGSFLNVCIHRMPLGESVVSPPSHCPHCQYAIPWALNIPLVTWVFLRGRCANCKAPISPRYFAVELLTALCFLSCWLAYGAKSPAVAFIYCVVLAGFIVATFIDFEHIIIPDEITLGGIAVGFLCSFAVPELHGETKRAEALKACFAGIMVGAGLIYAILRAGKLFFGRQRVKLEPKSILTFTETELHLPDKCLPYEEIFYRKTDAIRLEASRVEMADRCYQNVAVSLSPLKLQIGEDTFKPEEVNYLEVATDQIVLPREAMGFGDVKFMAAIGSFLGWKAVFFSLMFSSILGSAFGLATVLTGRREWSSRIPYGPYIAVAATVWIFAGQRILQFFFPPI